MRSPTILQAGAGLRVQRLYVLRAEHKEWRSTTACLMVVLTVMKAKGIVGQLCESRTGLKSRCWTTS